MNRHGNVTAWIIGVLAVLILSGAIFAVVSEHGLGLFNTGLFDIGSISCRETTIGGYAVSYCMPWGNSQGRCSIGGYAVATDNSAPGTLSMSMSSPNTGSATCARYTTQGSVTIRNIDPAKVDRLVIRRTIAMSCEAEQSTSNSCVAGSCVGTPESNSFSRTYNDILLSNNGAGFTIDAPEGRTIAVTKNPYDLEITASTYTASAARNHGCTTSISITGIETTPRNGASTTTTTPPTLSYLP